MISNRRILRQSHLLLYILLFVYRETGVFDPNYFPSASLQVRYVPDGKVLISFCMAIIFFISLF
uniref:Uncharacterized protein n=1 Tax=Trichobilharzia regenti TaxID=157069 RepID=A0AA85IWS7_TRIRE|nr:unnamed protein product [Trichobilharzia regenti]